VEQGQLIVAEPMAEGFEGSGFRAFVPSRPVRDPWSGLSVPAPQGAVPARTLVDFWQPRPKPRSRAPRLELWLKTVKIPFPDQEKIKDFWLAGTHGTQEATLVKAQDWAHLSDALPGFALHAAQNPFNVVARQVVTVPAHQRRARWMVQLLGEAGENAEGLVAFFEEVFRRFPERRSFRALGEMVVAEVPLATIERVCRFRMAWVERCAAWTAIRTPAEHRSVAMGFEQALRLVQLSKSPDPMETLEEAWFGEWLSLPPYSVQYRHLSDYVEARFDFAQGGAWAVPAQRTVGTMSPEQWRRFGLVGPGTPEQTSHIIRGMFGEMGFPDPLEHPVRAAAQ